MNSLTELNNYNNSLSISYTDNRIADVKFNKPAVANQSQVVDEGSEFNSSVGIEITDVADYSIAQPSYTINVSALEDCTVSWDTIPSGCTVTNPLTGVYSISGVNSKDIWDIIKYAKIQLPIGLPDAYFGNWSYTSTISYTHGTLGPLSKSWTTAVTVQDVTLLSNPGPVVYLTNANTILASYPQILSYLDSLYPSATWTVTAVPDTTLGIDSFSSSATGGTFTFNSETKGFTVSGTRTQVNNHLANLTLDSTSATIDFGLSYLLTNSQDSVTDTKIQVFRNSDIKILSNASTVTIFYTEDEVSYDVIGAPIIQDLANDGSGTYTVTVTPSDLNAIVSMTSAGVGGSSTFDAEDKILTISGTRTQVNDHLSGIIISLAVDYSSQFTLNYVALTPTFETATKYQTLVCNSNDTEISNMNIDRNYTSNQSNLIFSTDTPFISDFDEDESNVYTITLYCEYGLWSDDGISSHETYTFSGSRTEVDAKFSDIRFYSNAGVSSNITFVYTQSKNSVLQTTVIVNLIGSEGSYDAARTISLTTTQSWIPNLEDAIFGKISKLILIGGGGGGGYGTANSGGGGGGGAGVYCYTTPIILTPGQSYNIVVGVGGAGGTSSTIVGSNGGSTSALGFTADGGGGALIDGVGGSSGATFGSSYEDHSGMSGGLRSTVVNSLGGYNAGAGGGHPSSAPASNKNGTENSGGRGGKGFDEPEGTNGYIAAGGGGGGNPTKGPAGSGTAGDGANLSTLATSYGTGGINLGGGGGGGFNGSNGAKGNDGCIKITFVAR